MSVKAITWAKSVRTGSASRKAVLLVLADYAGVDNSACWPSQETIAFETEMTERNVRRCLADLEKMGLIARQPRWVDHRGRNTDVITLRVGSEEGLPDNLSGKPINRTNEAINRTSATDQPDICDRSTGHSVRGTVSEPVKNRVSAHETENPSDDEQPEILGRSARLYAEWRQTQTDPLSRRFEGALREGVREAIEEGFPEEAVRAGLDAWREKGRYPSSLPGFIQEEARRLPSPEQSNLPGWMRGLV